MTNTWFHAFFTGCVLMLVGTVVLEVIRPGSVVLYVPLWWMITALVVNGCGVVMNRAK